MLKVKTDSSKPLALHPKSIFNRFFIENHRIKLPSGQLGILLDTIGFITNLPHDLVESFKSTLEEVQDADIVLHIRDISHPNTEEQKNTVLEVLKELGYDEAFYTKRMVEVVNRKSNSIDRSLE